MVVSGVVVVVLVVLGLVSGGDGFSVGGTEIPVATECQEVGDPKFLACQTCFKCQGCINDRVSTEVLDGVTKVRCEDTACNQIRFTRREQSKTWSNANCVQGKQGPLSTTAEKTEYLETWCIIAICGMVGMLLLALGLGLWIFCWDRAIAEDHIRARKELDQDFHLRRLESPSCGLPTPGKHSELIGKGSLEECTDSDLENKPWRGISQLSMTDNSQMQRFQRERSRYMATKEAQAVAKKRIASHDDTDKSNRVSQRFESKESKTPFKF